MKRGVALAAMFTLGAIFGSGVTYILADKKLKANYEKQIEKEIESVREGFTRMQKELYEKNKLEKERIMDDYKNGLTSFGYVEEVIGKEEDADISEELKNEEPENLINQLVKNGGLPEVDKPTEAKEETKEVKSPSKNIYLITAEEYGELGDYETEDLSFYRDGTLTDSYGEPIEHPEQLLGEDLLDILATYLDSGFAETYVRNDLRRTDYEVDFADYDFLYE